jgi:hypothetical protein
LTPFAEELLCAVPGSAQHKVKTHIKIELIRIEDMILHLLG